MADEEQLRILRQGGKVWNAWRREAGESIDLGGADLSGADLTGTDLSEANLTGTDLSEADLSEADLGGAELTGADLSGADLTGADLGGADLSEADLSEANLRQAHLHWAVFSGANLSEANLGEANLNGADLSGANLTGTDLSEANVGGANLREADLSGANLQRAVFSRANLSGANLSGANLSEANLQRAVFSGANLSGADLSGANLSGANLIEANLSEASFHETIISTADLRTCKNLETIRHRGPSTIDIRTLQSSGRLPLTFLRGVGLPDKLIDYLPSLLGGAAIQHYSCFISYSSKDDDFARRLHADLQDKGVRCWFAPHDMKIGAKIRDTIDDAIRLRDKVLLVLSEASITSEWVEDEVDKAFEEERQRDGVVLFPVRVDDAVMETKEAWASKLRRSRNIGDFRAWKDHDAYRAALKRVLRDLQLEAAPRAGE